MNANPSSAASVGVSPNVEKLQGTPALQSTVVRAPERARAVVTTLETFLSASALAEPLQSKVALARLSTWPKARLRALPRFARRLSRLRADRSCAERESSGSVAPCFVVGRFEFRRGIRLCVPWRQAAPLRDRSW